MITSMVRNFTGLPALAAIRPEALRLTDTGTPATVTAVNFLGAATRVALDANGTRMTALLPKGAARPAVGQAVHVAWDAADMHQMKVGA
jgi:putative spermidine/putrescine transport system ATP-binding protein